MSPRLSESHQIRRKDVIEDSQEADQNSCGMPLAGSEFKLELFIRLCTVQMIAGLSTHPGTPRLYTSLIALGFCNG